jgi:hypothetical protein
MIISTSSQVRYCTWDRQARSVGPSEGSCRFGRLRRTTRHDCLVRHLRLRMKSTPSISSCASLRDDTCDRESSCPSTDCIPHCSGHQTRLLTALACSKRSSFTVTTWILTTTSSSYHNGSSSLTIDGGYAYRTCGSSRSILVARRQTGKTDTTALPHQTPIS